PVATGARRTGRRVLMVGTDCGVGKKFAALALHRELVARGMDATFRPTGQTGALIAGHGVALDTIPGDFIAGVAEALSPDNDADHWDVIEGQATVLHPTFAAVTVGLVHGSQPDAMVLCHEAGRTRMRGLPDRAVPGLTESIEAHERMAQVTRPGARVVAVSLNTSMLDEADAKAALDDASRQTGLPATDPIRFGASVLADAVLGAIRLKER
ncbi:MAG: NAD-dependent epimerase/dehydratase family protein, partial [Litorimonas sp.]